MPARQWPSTALVILGNRGERDKAFEWLERAYVARDGGLNRIKIDPLLVSLRADPRFASMLNKIGLPP